MKCPICKVGELHLYKETEKVYQYQITKNNKIYKKPFSELESDTIKDFLECENMGCNEYFDYELDSNGKIVKDSVVVRVVS